MTVQLVKYLAIFFTIIVLSAFAMFITAIWSDTPGFAQNLASTGALIGVPSAIGLIVSLIYIADNRS